MARHPGAHPVQHTFQLDCDMQRKINNLHRLLKKMAGRYGESDPDIDALRSELAMLESAWKPESGRNFASLKARSFESPAKQLYRARAPSLRV